MARIEQSVEIAAAPTTVFRFCHDLARRPEWDERVVAAKLITPAPLRRGSLIRIDAGRSGAFDFTWEAEYVRYQFPSSSTIKAYDVAPSSPFKSSTEKWDFSKTGDGTRMTLVWEYKPRSLIARLLDFVMRRAGNRHAVQRSLQHLKTLMEAE
jgi:ribosome-associated toxin RatA of RatAB toxin-antitoxin module